MNRAIKDFRFRNSDFGKSRRCRPSATSLREDSTNHKSQFPNQASPSSRRGILLLVVLTMLTLFLLIGTAYLVSASHFRKMNKVMARSVENQALELVEASLLDQVINQLVRDTKNPFSALRFHSLLRDMYGSEGFTIDSIDAAWAGDSISAGSNVTNGQFLELRFDNTAEIHDSFGNRIDFDHSQATGNTALSSIKNAYNGLVLTFLNGEVEGLSTRIIGYRYDDTTGDKYFTVVTTKKTDGSVLTDPDDLDDTRILINGRPYNGTGFGFNRLATSGAKLSAEELVPTLSGATISGLVALLPNPVFFNPEQISGQGPLTPNGFYLNDAAQYYLSNDPDGLLPEELVEYRLQQGAQVGLTGIGGADESYDAPDFQNVALGMLPYAPIETTMVPGANDPPNANELGNMVLPSFHRPALINYWSKLGALDNGTDFESNMLRKVLLRPSWMDHPNFTGSNPEFESKLNEYQATPNDADLRRGLINRMIYGPWDVDNDNDGVRDSVWIDFGAPAIPGPDGKMVKPLAAVLVLDMDGRLNLNAHGSKQLAGASSYSIPPTTVAGGVSTEELPRGEGLGPAEISLTPVLGDRFEWLVKGVQEGKTLTDPTVDAEFNVGVNSGSMGYQRSIPGRYGAAVNPTATFPPIFPGFDGAGNGNFDPLAQLKMQGMPRTFQNPSNYGTPPDLNAQFAMPALNDLGQPIYEMARPQNGTFVTGNAPIEQDSAYELNLSAEISRGEDPNSADKAFSLTELERLLRAYDTDTGTLPDRLWQLSGNFYDEPTSTTPNVQEVNKWRTMLTSDSYDLPVPSVVVPEWMVVGLDGQPGEAGNDDDGNGVVDDSSEIGWVNTDDFQAVMGKPPVNASFVDILEYRIRFGLGYITPPLTTAQQDDVRRSMALLLPQDLANGVRMDVNRPFGNGRDDDNPGDPGYGVVDEPGENEGAYWAIDRTRAGVTGATPLDNFDDTNYGSYHDVRDRDGDGMLTDAERGDIDSSGLVGDTYDERFFLHNLRRQDMARDMFVLAMTLVDPIYTDPSNMTNEQKARVRKIAQWAINSVDFRDPDNIMTAFEFDYDPFTDADGDGICWDVDGDLLTDENTTLTNPDREVIWGAERPELLITETLAWHDRRTEDTGSELASTTGIEKPNQVGPDNEDDSDYDQHYRPQGAGFIELYNPWPQNPAACSDIHDMHSSPGNDMGVDLARTHNDTISNQDPTTGSPVWRINIYKTFNSQDADDIGGPHLDPDATLDENRAKGADRSIYFVTQDPGYDDDGVAYFTDFANPRIPPVRPGRYLVVGGGGGGSEVSPNTNQVFSPFGFKDGLDDESSRGIMLDTDTAAPASVALMASNGTSLQDIDGHLCEASPDLCGVAIINNATNPVTGSPESVGFSFSEPPGGYILKDGTQASFKMSIVLDTPLDDQRSGGIGLGGADATELAAVARDNENRLRLPMEGAGVGLGGAGGTIPAQNARRTIPGFSWAYLQRLANPLLAWNPEPGKASHDNTLPVNPYMTVDSMGVNVSVFNGMEPEEKVKYADGSGFANGEFDNDDAVDAFASLQRGRNNTPITENSTNTSSIEALVDLQERALSGNRNRSTPAEPELTPANSASLWGSEFVGRDNGMKMGFVYNRAGPLAESPGVEPNDNSYNFKGVPDCTLGFLNEPFRAESAASDYESKQRPTNPFPWLNWNNRPFISANELLQVPAYRSSQLLQVFTYNYTGGIKEKYDNNDRLNLIRLSDSNVLELDGVFGHLLNFFRSEEVNGPDGTPNTQDDLGIAGMYRVLDYLHTPSPFVGTETWFNPAAFYDDPSDSSDDITSTNDPRYGLQPPFNRISAYRDPGRVNLNTVVDADIWDGLFHDNSGALVEHESPRWDDSTDPNFITSRRGYGNSERKFLLNSSVPTFFANPFRSASTGATVPLPNMVQNKETNCTLLREEGNTPLFAGDEDNAHNNTDRNSYFRYQPMTRLDNLTTTRSNVYAVWVTIGFFEVEEAPQLTQFEMDNSFAAGDPAAEELYNKVYPEGYQLGKEYGIETGDIRRVRQFAIVDRSIPVAFEPGSNHNIENAIRLKRRIE